MKASDDKIGKKVLCSECGSPVMVPETDKVAVEAIPDSGGAASSFARDLLKSSSASSKRSREETLPRRPGADEEGVDWTEIRRQVTFVILPGVGGVVALFMLIYWLSSMMFGGGVEHPPLARVRGVVTLDGEPLADATVMFLPIEVDGERPGREISSSVGSSDADGAYELFYVERVRGAVPGTHKVTITKRNETGRQILPARYNSQTELESKVPGDEPYDFDLTSR